MIVRKSSFLEILKFPNFSRKSYPWKRETDILGKLLLSHQPKDNAKKGRKGIVDFREWERESFHSCATSFLFDLRCSFIIDKKYQKANFMLIFKASF